MRQQVLLPSVQQADSDGATAAGMKQHQFKAPVSPLSLFFFFWRGGKEWDGGE